jgi:hypothetical protein
MGVMKRNARVPGVLKDTEYPKREDVSPFVGRLPGNEVIFSSNRELRMESSIFVLSRCLDKK